MPVKLKKTIGEQIYLIPASQLKALEGYKLRPETTQAWLQKGIRFEKLALYREEVDRPAAQLVVFREHPRMGGSPFHTDHPNRTRIGKVTLHRIT